MSAGFSSFRKVVAATVFVTVVLGGVVFWPTDPDDEPPTPAVTEIDAALHMADSLQRARAVKRLARADDGAALHAILARAADEDWRVRGAAFEALDRRMPLDGPAPLRGTRLDKREPILLDWLDRWDTRHGTSLSDEICEIFARDEHLHFGVALTKACYRCHAPQVDTARAEAAGVAAARLRGRACAECHPAIGSQWRAGAHAQSLTHLNLKTVDYAQREVVWLDHSARAGASCVACHTVTGDRAAEPDVSACDFTFTAPAGSQSCAQCHHATQRQWEQWRAGRQPRVATWPTGQIELDRTGDMRTCVDCHMKRIELVGGATITDHRLAARRDTALLAASVHLEIRPMVTREDNRRVVPIVLTNLTGHAFPTGTRRRAVDLHVAYDDGDPLSLPPLATLVPDRPGNMLTGVQQTALAPGEQRVFEIEPRADARQVTAALQYRRNRFDDTALMVEIVRRSATLVGRQSRPFPDQDAP